MELDHLMEGRGLERKELGGVQRIGRSGGLELRQGDQGPFLLGAEGQTPNTQPLGQVRGRISP